MRHALAEQTHLILPQRRGVRAGRRHRLTRPSEYDECCRSGTTQAESTGERTGAHRTRGRQRKRTEKSGFPTPSTLIERRGDEVVCKSHKRREDLSSSRPNAPQAGAFGRLSRETAWFAHFTRAARPHTHPSDFHSPSARESATALARTHARSTRTRSRPAEAFSRQTEDLIGRLVSTRALRDVRLHDGRRARRRGQRARRQGAGSPRRWLRAVPRRAPLWPPRGVPPPPARFVGVDVDAARPGRSARGGALVAPRRGGRGP